MKRRHWRKALAFCIMIPYIMISRSLNWIDNNWFGILSALNFAFLMISLMVSEGIDMTITAGPGGISISEKKEDKKLE